MPAGPDGGSAAGPGGPRTGSAALTSGRGRKTTTLRSTPAGASPPASLTSTTLPPKDTDPRPDHDPASPAQIILALTASQRHPAAPSCRHMRSREATHGSADDSVPLGRIMMLICG